MKYKHIGYEERIEISEMYGQGISICKIAKLLNRPKCTISREIKRNSREGRYWPDSADRSALYRKQRGNKINRNLDMQLYIIRSLIDKRWSPEQIAATLKLRHGNFGTASYETIYKWIYRPYEMHSDCKYWQYLARHKRKRGLRKSNNTIVSNIPNRISIHERPEIVNKKEEFGHWEGDLMSFIKNSQHILVLHERKSLFIQSAVLEDKSADSTTESLLGLMKPLPASARKTLTLDNGGEFAEHEKYKDIGLQSFFCDPYASWQKGGVENSNGRLRIVLPRDTNVKQMGNSQFEQIILNHNSTPRKALGWLTPSEAFNKNLSEYCR